MGYLSFLKIDGVNGSSLQSSVESYSFSVETTSPASFGSGGGFSRALISDLTITKMLDSSSPLLFQAAIENTVLPAVQLMLLPASQNSTPGAVSAPTAVYTLTNAVINSVKDAGNQHGGDFPMEQVQFNFSKIDITVGVNEFSFRKSLKI